MPVIRVPARPRDRDYYWAPDIYRTIRREKWALVHCQGYHTFVPALAMAASAQERLPYVVTFHSGGHDSATRNRMRAAQHLVLRPLLRGAARLIAVSDWEARHFADELHLGLNHSRSCPTARSWAWAPPLRERPGDAVLGRTAGRIGRPARALQGPPARHRGNAVPAAVEPDARLRIVGGGPYEAELRRLAAASGVGERIEIGPIDATDRSGMAALLASADVVVAMSEYESQGIAVLEALALRRRVVVADSSALSEFARAGVARGVPLDATPEELAGALHEELRGGCAPRSSCRRGTSARRLWKRIYAEVLAS